MMKSADHGLFPHAVRGPKSVPMDTGLNLGPEAAPEFQVLTRCEHRPDYNVLRVFEGAFSLPAEGPYQPLGERIRGRRPRGVFHKIAPQLY